MGAQPNRLLCSTLSPRSRDRAGSGTLGLRVSESQMMYYYGPATPAQNQSGAMAIPVRAHSKRRNRLSSQFRSLQP
jgi:hypothetical protein